MACLVIFKGTQHMFTEVSTYISGKMLNFGDTEEYLLELDAAHIELTGHCTY